MKNLIALALPFVVLVGCDKKASVDASQVQISVRSTVLDGRPFLLM
jgi:hypothetical protein